MGEIFFKLTKKKANILCWPLLQILKDYSFFLSKSITIGVAIQMEE